MKNRKIYAITGVMGSGKSKVASMIREAGYPVLDADQIAREILTPRYSAYRDILSSIESTFGADVPEGESLIFEEHGTPQLNRPALGKIVFADSGKLAKLNSITHPHVQALFREKVRSLTNPGNGLVFYDIPLVFESGAESLYDGIILVYTPEKLALRRAVARTGLSEAEVAARLAKQISIEKKREMADYIIDNSKSLENTWAQVRDLLAELEDRSKNERAGSE